MWTDEYLDILDLQLEVRVSWDRRYSELIATAEVTLDFELARIALSPKLFKAMRCTDRPEVIAHEVCHLAAWVRHGFDIDEHGREWIALMNHLGYAKPRVVIAV